MKKLRLLMFGFALSVVVGLASCGTNAGDICDMKCECEGCDESEYNKCLRESEDDFYESEDRGCADLYDEYLACQDDRAYCDDGDFEEDCKPEKERWKDCVD